jgi:hypothetical protein
MLELAPRQYQRLHEATMCREIQPITETIYKTLDEASTMAETYRRVGALLDCLL